MGASLLALAKSIYYICNIYLSGCDKRYLQKFQVRFNNLTLEEKQKKKHLKVANTRKIALGKSDRFVTK